MAFLGGYIEGLAHKYVIGPRIRSALNYAGTKFPVDMMNIAEGRGYHKISINEGYQIRKPYHLLLDLLKLLFIKRSSDVIYIDIVSKRLSRKIVYRLLSRKKCRIYPIIEDINCLRQENPSLEELTSLLLLNEAEVIISQCESMTEWLKKQGIVRPFVELEMLDFIGKSSGSVKKLYKRPLSICYGGNLSKDQSGFIFQLEGLKPLSFNIYGGNLSQDELPTNVSYKGEVKEEKYTEFIKGDWGLVWNGSSLKYNVADKRTVYYQYVCPHKMSMYALCGIPVIVHAQSASAHFVKENKCGLVINDFVELPVILNQIQLDDYVEMQKNISIIGKRVASGFYLGRAIKIIELLNID